jgi:hypothetical protein
VLTWRLIAAGADKTIFDDDWTTPPRAQAAAPLVPASLTTGPATAPATAQTTAPEGGNATAPPAEPPSVASEQRPAPIVHKPVGSRAVPSAAEQSRVRKLFKEVYARELADATAQGRRTLALKLLAEAKKSGDAAVDRFVLLMGARLAAIQAMDLGLAVRATDALAAEYDVDALKLKVDAAMKGWGKSDNAADTGDNCRAALELVDALVAVNDYAGASRIGVMLRTVAVADPMFDLLAQQRVKEVEASRAVYERLGASIEKLKASPGDPGANAAAGTFLCYFKGDWERGLPMLAKGSDAAAKSLAKSELAQHAPDNTAIEQLADGWWTLAEKQREVPRARVREHAARMYARIVSGVTGLRRTAMEKRIAEAGGAELRLVDLLAVADAERDAVNGRWSLVDGQITTSDSETRLELPYQPPEEYMFRVEFSRTGGNAVYQAVSKSGTGVFFVMGGNHNVDTGLEKVRGLNLRDGPARVDLPLTDGRRYVGIVEVRNGRLRAFVDGKVVVDWKTDYRDLSYLDSNRGWQPRDPILLAVGAYQTTVTFDHIELLELAGHGKGVR